MSQWDCGFCGKDMYECTCPPEPKNPDLLDQVIAPVIKKLEKRLSGLLGTKSYPTFSGAYVDEARIRELRYALRLLKAGLRGLR